MNANVRRVVLSLALTTLSACSSWRTPAPVAGTVLPPSTDSIPRPTELQVALGVISPMVVRGEFDRADSALALFSMQHDATCPGAEADYLRALLKLSPHNSRGRALEAVPLLDKYLGSTCLSAARAAEIVFVRKLAFDVAQRGVSDSASAEEVRKLREQLDQTKKELDRLKMRVIQPL